VRQQRGRGDDQIGLADAEVAGAEEHGDDVVDSGGRGPAGHEADRVGDGTRQGVRVVACRDRCRSWWPSDSSIAPGRVAGEDAQPQVRQATAVGLSTVLDVSTVGPGEADLGLMVAGGAGGGLGGVPGEAVIASRLWGRVGRRTSPALATLLASFPTW
jgi:hypothetical protein